jgi:hypothetical protein
MVGGELACAALPPYRVLFACGADAAGAAAALPGTAAAPCAVSARLPCAASLSYAVVLACGTGVDAAVAPIPAAVAAPGTAAGDFPSGGAEFPYAAVLS